MNKTKKAGGAFPRLRIEDTNQLQVDLAAQDAREADHSRAEHDEGAGLRGYIQRSIQLEPRRQIGLLLFAQGDAAVTAITGLGGGHQRIYLLCSLSLGCWRQLETAGVAITQFGYRRQETCFHVDRVESRINAIEVGRIQFVCVPVER